ncbi:MAG TPA: NAD(P)/FAD-dependent oxidoreductase [Chloroflexota bacterium]|nr:NAD(P)/FAD-dependent oxidoreductase [Chloroflexota bacterium]
MVYEVAIVGAGPAGLSAAVYTARNGLKTLVLGDPDKSRVNLSKHFDNYLGFPEGISGKELMERSVAQAVRFGAEIVRGEVVGLLPGDPFKLELAKGETYEARAVILATGVAGKPSGIKGEEELIGQGVSHCVVCDGFFYRDRKVAVIGNANYAAKEAIELLAYSRDVTIFSNGRLFSIDDGLRQRLDQEGIALKDDRIAEFTHSGNGLEGIKLRNGELFPAEGVFIALGTAGSADFARTMGIELDGNSIVIDREGRTSFPGIYAAGDCTVGPQQMARAVGEGCVAALSVIAQLQGLEKPPTLW